MIKALLLFVVLLNISFSLSVRTETVLTEAADGGISAPLDVVATYEESNTRAKRQASERAVRWAKNTVYYYFDTSIVDKALIRRKLKSIRDRTCINFVENATAVNRIRVTQGEACQSHIGMKGGEQIMSLPDPRTNNGAVEHEFMHALGFLHTYVRHDRNSYIKVNLTNVKTDMKSTFTKQNRTLNYTPYEYGSILHHSGVHATNAIFAETMTPLQARFIRTTGSKLITFYDISMINKHYKCNALCAGKGVTGKCVNGGVPNPRNCNACICPNGYGGTLCGQRKAGCGATLAAATTWKSRSITLGNSTITDIRESYTICNDWITAPSGKKIQIKVTSLKDVTCSYECPYSSIEPKTLTDKAMTSPRICCTNQLHQILASNVNPTPVVTYSVSLQSTFVYNYRYV